MLAFESLIGRPVHALGLAAFPIKDTSLPAQPIPQLVRLAACPFVLLLLLGSVG